jgi:DNA-directed RNA polymerase specialized sigma subunit
MKNPADNTEIEALIKKIVTETVLNLKIAGLMNNNRNTAIEKTEYLLNNYNEFKKGYTESGISKKYIEIIENAIKEIQTDEYFSIIPMRYFEKQSREKVAEHFDVSVTTITRHQRELIERLSVLIFSDDVIYELFL